MLNHKKKEQVYRAVMALLQSDVPPGNIKVSDIAKAAGIGKGSIYMYFESKEQVIAQAVIYHIEEQAKSLLGFDHRIYESFQKALEAFLLAHTETFRQYSNVFNLTTTGDYMHFFDKQCRPLFLKTVKKMRSRYGIVLQGLLNKGVEEGVISAPVSSFMLLAIAQMIFATNAYHIQEINEPVVKSIDELVEQQCALIFKILK